MQQLWLQLGHAATRNAATATVTVCFLKRVQGFLRSFLLALVRKHLAIVVPIVENAAFVAGNHQVQVVETFGLQPQDIALLPSHLS